MNRTLAILLAMAMLLAHGLALHLTPEGNLGEPYEYAHRAYHLARNLIQEGSLVWNVGLEGSARGGIESYPSPLWVLISALAERLYLPVTRTTQLVGMAAALMTVRYSVMFDRDRILSVIPALLLVTSGAFAAAAPSGLEFSLIALLLTAAFVAFERAKQGPFALALGLLVLARPAGVLAVVLFAAYAVRDRLRREREPEKEVQPLAFLPAVLVTAVLLLMPNSSGHSLYGTWLGHLLRFQAEQASQGLGYLSDLFATAITPILVVYPIGSWVTGRLTRTGRRALVWSAWWMTVVTLQGGGLPHFSVALVPALPLLAIAIQQGILASLDSKLRHREKMAWIALLLTCLLGVVASTAPFSWRSLQAQVPFLGGAETSAPPPRVLGKASIAAELQRTRKLRSVGLFLRENVPATHTLLSPYVGAVSYLSGMQVLDLSGQATAPTGTDLAAPWDPNPPINLLAALEQDADYILWGLMRFPRDLSGAFDLGFDELLQLDGSLDDAARRTLIGNELDEYELVTVPVRSEYRGRVSHFPLLRRRDLGLTPELEIRRTQDGIQVRLKTNWPGASVDWPGNPQLVRLAVEGTDERGRVWYLDPQGNPCSKPRIFTRPDLLLQPTPLKPIRLVSFPLLDTPKGLRLVSLRAQLFNPHMLKWSRFGAASPQASLVLD